MRLIVNLLAALIVFTISCGPEKAAEQSASDPVSVVRIRQGEKIGGECRFAEDISQYPVTPWPPSENCFEAVTIGPIQRDALEQMKRDRPLFWENSYPWQQVLPGEWIDGECKFTGPVFKVFEEISETLSTDWITCLRTIEMGPVTQKQVEEIERLGTTERSTAIPAPAVPVLD